MAAPSSQTPAAIRIDTTQERLWRGSEAVPLRPKTWAVLCYLTGRPGALVTKNELLDAVWPDTAVTEGTLNKSIAELRQAVGDDSDKPRFIETVSRRGFRWIGGTEVLGPQAVAEKKASPAADVAPPVDAPPPLHLVGRDAEMAALEKCFARVTGGARQVVFVSGEAGAGKSSLVDAFQARIDGRGGATLFAYGQCVESYGQHEPYGPLLESIERLARHPGVGASVVAALRTHAPTWLRQMPSLGEAPEGAIADGPVTPARMLREIATALEEISREQPLLMILEDIHWADHATMDACNLIARRRDPARLMLVVTLRPADALVAQHPALAAKTELTSRGLATDLPVATFTPAFVQEYLEERCAGLDLDPELAGWIHHQTAGNPLFVRIVVDELIQRQILAAQDDGRWQLQGSPRELREFVPDSLRELVERQLDRLSPTERALTESGCVLPLVFSASTVAGLAGLSEEEAEDCCTELARRGQILKRADRDGTNSRSRCGGFSFVHSMVRRILHDRISASRLRRLHLAAAEQLQREHPDLGDAVAVQLALHFAMAEDPVAAILHLQRAAASVQSIPAPREVVVIREQILDLVKRNPDLPGYRRERLVATMNLAQARQLAFAVVDAETNALCEHVIELAEGIEDERERFLASMGVFSNRFYTGRYREALEIGQRLLTVANNYQHPFMIKSAEFAIAGAAYRLGDFGEAQAHFQSCLEHAAASQETYGWDFQSLSLSHLAVLAVHFGRPGDARRLIQEADEHEHRDGATPDAAAIPLRAYALALLRDDANAMVLVGRSLLLVDRIGAAAWIERARFLYGLLLSRNGRTQEGIERMKESLERQARQPVFLDRSAYCCLLADEMLRRGVDGAQPIVEEAMAFSKRSGERHFEAEIYRLRGELRLAANGHADSAAPALAEADFRHAISCAGQRGARWDEVVATTSLARLLHRQGHRDKARTLIDTVCAEVEGADDLAEVRQARELFASPA